MIKELADDIVHIIRNHPLLAVFVTWLVGNLVAALPTPTDNSWQIYRFFFRFATLLGSSLPRSLPRLRIPSPSHINDKPDVGP